MIPVNTPLIGKKEEEYVLDCLKTGWISSEGHYVKEFEKRLASYVNRKHGITVMNGTVALELALQVLGIKEGDEVILPSFTIISCANAIVKLGATPVVVDSEESTWNMDVSKIEEKITSETKAIMIVHLYGLPVDVDPVLELAKKHNLYIIEDAAEMHGQTYKGKQCGSFGDISTFSFYSNKNITTGEGGMVVTNSDELAEKCAYYRNLCFKPERRFVHEHVGSNFRMTNMQAALGLAQLERIDEIVKMKRNLGRVYREALSNIPFFSFQPSATEFAENIYWVFGILPDSSIKKDASFFMNKLADEGIGTRPFFWPIHSQPVFADLFPNAKLPVSENLGTKGFYIPSGLGIKEEEIEIVIEKVKKVSKYV